MFMDSPIFPFPYLQAFLVSTIYLSIHRPSLVMNRCTTTVLFCPMRWARSVASHQRWRWILFRALFPITECLFHLIPKSNSQRLVVCNLPVETYCLYHPNIRMDFLKNVQNHPSELYCDALRWDIKVGTATWASTAGLYCRSKWITCVAAVRVRPTPPASTGDRFFF